MQRFGPEKSGDGRTPVEGDLTAGSVIVTLVLCIDPPAKERR